MSGCTLYSWTNCIFWSRALSIPCPHSYVFPALPANAEAHSQQELTASSHCPPETSDSSRPTALSSERDDCEFDEGHSSTGRQKEKVAHPPIPDREMVKEDILNGSDRTEAQNISGGQGGQEDAVCVEGLVPGIDFCNHGRQVTALWEVDGQEGAMTGIPCSMYLVTLPGYSYHLNDEIRIKYGSKGNEELLFLYGFVLEDNPDDFIMVHYPRQALLQLACSEAKLQLLQEQELELRWLLSLSLLKKGFLRQAQSEEPDSTEEPPKKQVSCGYSWSGNRPPPRELDRIVFPEAVIAALRTVAMTEAELHATVGLLDELTESGQLRQPSKEDISAAVWEICGDAGGYRLLIDLLTSLKIGLEEGTGTRQMDAQLLEQDMVARARLEAVQQSRSEGTSLSETEKSSIRRSLLTDNKRSCIIYRMGQKQLAELFLAAAKEALAFCEEDC